jgi:hypothetical protein
MITSDQSFKMYETIKKYLGNNADARFLVNGIKDIAKEVVDSELAKQIALLATREDVHKLEVRMEKGINEMMKWLIVLMLGFLSLTVAVIKLSLP